MFKSLAARAVSLASGSPETVTLRLPVEGFSARQIADAKNEFSASHYLAANPDLAAVGVSDPWLHYLTLGWRRGLDPSPCFSTTGYLQANPDVRQSGLNPLLHYVAYGRKEGRHAPAPAAPAETQAAPARTGLPAIPWYMDLGARGKAAWKDCPEDLRDDVSFFLDHGWIKLERSVPAAVIARAREAFFAHKARHQALYDSFADSKRISTPPL